MNRALPFVLLVSLVLGVYVTPHCLAAPGPVQKSPPVLGLAWTESAEGRTTIALVEPGSPAAKTGLRKGDVVTSVDDVRMTRGADLEAALKEIKPGQRAVLGVLRGDEFLRVVLIGPEGKVGIFGAMVHVDNRGQIRVAEVPPGTPAAAAGIKPGDALLAVAGHVPKSLDGLVEYATRLVSSLKPGEKVALKVAHDEQEHEFVLEVPTAQTPVRAPLPGVANALRAVVLGIAVREQGTQVIVTQVIDSGPASKAGIQRNDAIVSIGNEQVTSYASLMAAIKAAQVGDKVSVQLMRGSQPRTVIVVPINNDTSISDVVLDSSEDVGDIAVEVKQLKVRVGELTRIVDELSRELQELKRR